LDPSAPSVARPPPVASPSAVDSASQPSQSIDRSNAPIDLAKALNAGHANEAGAASLDLAATEASRHDRSGHDNPGDNLGHDNPGHDGIGLDGTRPHLPGGPGLEALGEAPANPVGFPGSLLDP